MTTLLPLLALVVAAFGYGSARPSEGREKTPIERALATILIVLGAAYVIFRFAPADEHMPLFWGLAAGSIPVLIAAYLPSRKGWEPGILALGASGPAFLLWLQDPGPRTACLALIAAAGFAALTLGDETASLTAIAASVTGAATVMGRYGSSSPAFTHAGVAIALGLAIIGLFTRWVVRMAPAVSRFSPVIASVLALGLAYAIGNRYLWIHVAWVSMGLAVLAGLAVRAVVPEDDSTDPGRAAIAAILWVGLGTLAFGLARGYGMSLALLIAVGVHVALGERKALLSTGPLLGLVMYRIFREAHVDATRALDIGQHYALVGLLMGAVLPLIPMQWWASKPERRILQAIGGLLWGLLWCAFPPLTALLLGPKGVVGFVAGLGFGGLFGLISTVQKTSKTDDSTVSTLPLALVAGGGGLAVVAYGWLDDLTNLTRDEKLHWLLGAAAPMVVLAGLLALLNYRKAPKAAAIAEAV